METRIGRNTDGNENGGVIFIHLGVRSVHGELLRKCRAIWQIARTIYQIVLQIFIPLGAP
ncbi:MAG: hypothetical protein V9G20_32410 [Candidatus Promineifilaceae bacterium]